MSMKLYLPPVWAKLMPAGRSVAVQSTAPRPLSGWPAFQAVKLFTFSLLIALSGTLSAAAQSTGTLVGSSTAVTSRGTVNLTDLGSSDWAHWGAVKTNTKFDHKSLDGVTPVGLISNYTIVGGGAAGSYPYNLVNCRWANGMPTAGASTYSEVYTGNNGHGFRISVPADTTSRTLTLYVGGYNDTATLTAHLSDGSALDFSDSSYGFNKPGNTNGHNYQAVYTLTYNAASAGQTLTVSWVQTSAITSGGNVNLQAAALAVNAASHTFVPDAPTGLTATPQWATSCPVCGGMAMPHIVLGCHAVSGATSYTIYRDGVKIQAGLTAPSWTDMTVVSGKSYTYTATASDADGESDPSASATAIAPSNPNATSNAMVTAPVNLCITGLWQNDSTDALTWTPVPGATGYNVYQYGTQLASHVTSTSYLVPTTLWARDMTYTVTALDSMGMETLPSAPTTAQGRFDPAQSPPWLPGLPAAPHHLATTAEWNAGEPRIHLTWCGDGNDYTYTVYRDGSKVASGLWGLNYFDEDVAPGETHTYAVTGSNLPWINVVESALSQSVTGTALSALPVAAAAPVQITGVDADDDSARVSFAPVPGAADYRIYNVANPNSVKYSGGGLSIEMNGLDPVNGADLVVEAVDKLGPFQTMDGMAGPGAMQMDGMHSAINGQGDPSNIPNVLAASAPFHVTLTPVTLAGDQVFFDNFRGEQPLVKDPMPTVPAGSFYGNPIEYTSVSNDKWTFRDYGGDIANSKVFFMGNHFMDTLYDGGQPRSSDPMHNNNASLVMMPKTTADISGGKVLHATFEMDAHFGCNERRWCEIQIAAAGDLLIQPGKVEPGDGTIRRATLSGNELRWEIQGQFHDLFMYTNSGTPNAPIMKRTNLINLGYGPHSDRGTLAARVNWDGTPLANGTSQDLDKRHKFDLYLSQTHIRVMENGLVVKDMDLPQALPFSQCQVYFVHQVYHTGNDRPELVSYYANETYTYNYRPWADERHWDNMGQSVLNAFPN